jgi:uncharacterized membrane protein YidH (DUF202 family)
MKLTKIIISELVILVASIFVFRSLWMMLDKYFNDTHLEVMLIIGIVTMIFGTILLHQEIKCEIKKLQHNK